MKKTVTGVVLAFLLVFAVGCVDAPAVLPPQDTQMDAISLPGFSTKVTGTMPQDPVEQESIRPDKFEFHLWNRLDGSTATIPLTTAIAANLEAIPPEEAQKLVTHNTTHAAYMNLFSGAADLIFVTYSSVVLILVVLSYLLFPYA